MEVPGPFGERPSEQIPSIWSSPNPVPLSATMRAVLALAFHAGRLLGGEPKWESAPELGGCGLL